MRLLRKKTSFQFHLCIRVGNPIIWQVLYLQGCREIFEFFSFQLLLCWGRIQRKTWFMGPYGGVDCNLTLCRLQSQLQVYNTFTMGNHAVDLNPKPKSTLAPSHVLRIWPLIFYSCTLYVQCSTCINVLQAYLATNPMGRRLVWATVPSAANIVTCKLCTYYINKLWWMFAVSMFSAVQSSQRRKRSISTFLCLLQNLLNNKSDWQD